MGAGLSRGSAAGRWYGPAPHASRALRVPAGPAAPALDPRVPAGPAGTRSALDAWGAGPHPRPPPAPLDKPARIGLQLSRQLGGGLPEDGEVPKQRVAPDPIRSQVLDRDTLDQLHGLDSRLDHLLQEQDVTPPTGAEPPPVRPRADARAVPPATLGRPAARTAPTTRLTGLQSPSRVADRAAARTGRPRHSTVRQSHGPPNRTSSVGRCHTARRRQPAAHRLPSHPPRSLSKASPSHLDEPSAEPGACNRVATVCGRQRLASGQLVVRGGTSATEAQVRAVRS